MSKSFTFSIIFLITCLTALSQHIVVNEFMSSNENTILDKDGESSDWIEIYNNGEYPVVLTDYYLSDDDDEIRKWGFPSISINPHDFLLIFASGKDISDTTELHTNFKLNQSGEPIILSNENSIVIDYFEEIALETDESYGRFPDGDTILIVFSVPTPGTTNNNASLIISSHESGFYSNDFFLNLTCENSNETIYYTLDGSEPTTNSIQFTDSILVTDKTLSPNIFSTIPTTPLIGPYQLNGFIWKIPETPVSKGTVIKYRSFDSETPKSKVYIKTFFVFPELEERYTFPVVSIITDSLNLFDYDTGIYIPGKTFSENGWNWWPSGNYHNKGIDWERNVNIEFFDNEGNLGFQTDAGMRMHGYGSAALSQKSFKIYFRSEYGKSSIKYPIFANSSVNEFKRLIFRNSGNDFIYTHFRDALLQDLIKNLDMETQNFRPSVVFLNGEYWGIHNIRERYDEYYFETHFNIKEENLVIAGVCGSVVEGSGEYYLELFSFIKDNDISVEENYIQIKDWIDINNYIDYNIAEIYYANYDWPCNNYKMWKSTDIDSKWRWLIYDLDYSFAYDNDCKVDFNSFEFATEKGVTGWPNCDCSTLLLRSLSENEDFKQQFVERFAVLLNTIFHPDTVCNKIDYFRNLYSTEINEHIERWSHPETIMQWGINIDRMKHFALKRPCIIQKQIMDFFNLDHFDFDCKSFVSDMGNNNLNVFPNPNNGNFKLRCEPNYYSIGEIQIINTFGQILFTKQVNFITNTIEINLPEIPTGLYILKLKNYDSLMTKKIIIRR